MKTFVVYFRYQKAGEKKPGPVTHYKIQATSKAEAQHLLKRFANYPGLEIIRIEEVGVPVG